MAPKVVSVRIRSSCCLILAIALAACTESSRPSIPTQPGPAGAAPGLASLTLEGPASIAPGTTARYTVTARDTDGRTADVTSEALWASSASDVLAIASPGVVTAHARGDARVNVHYRNLGSHRDVVVLPDNTYRLIGQVTEAETASVPISGVNVEAPLAGPAFLTRRSCRCARWRTARRRTGGPPSQPTSSAVPTL